MNSRIEAIILLLLLIATINIHAQNEIKLDVPRIVPISPTAAAMEKYLTYPVDHATGIPNISIPLYEIIAGEVSIPVSLSYHASGLKPKDGNSLAGTGWTLNLEPSVTRQVCGAADESYYGWFNNPRRDYYPSNENSIISYYESFVNNGRDIQPDKFSYRLANGSGSGYFADKFRFLSIPRNNDKVEYNDANGMLITDANGVEYVFNGTREKSGDLTTRWMCSSIRSSRNPTQTLVSFSYYTISNKFGPSHYYNLDNKIIINTYRSGNTIKNTYIKQTTNSNLHYLIQYQPLMGTGVSNAVLTPISESEAGMNFPLISRYIPDNMTVARLDEVKFFGNKILVYHTSVGNVPYNSEIFDKIEVIDKDGAIIRNIKFYITPYNSYTSLTKLDSVVISAPGTESRKYTFNYHNPGRVPSIYTLAVDHWGFCNGGENRSEPTVPSFDHVFSIPDVNGGARPNAIRISSSGANREPDHEWTKTGILTKITDPQGITTEFIHEGNFGAFRNDNKSYNKDYLHPVGGLRIKRINIIDPKTRKAIYKNYKYGLTKHEVTDFNPVWGGGAIKHIVTIRDYTSTLIHRSKDFSTNSYWSNDLTTIGSMPQSNISFNTGSAAMYNIVLEEISNSQGDVSKTKYYYNVKAHKFENILDWDDSDPAGSVKTSLNQLSSNILQQIALKLPAHPHVPPDDLVDHYVNTNQFYGAPIRTEYFRNNDLVASTEYIYKKVRVWGGNISVDIPHRLISGETTGLNSNDVFVTGNYYSPESSGKVQTTYYLDTENYRAIDKEINKEYYYRNGWKDIVTTEKKYNYDFDFIIPGSSLRPRCIETINSDKVVIIDSLDYLQGYPAILSRHKHIENNTWKESRILFKPNSCIPEKVQSRTNQMSEFRDEIKYNAYDSYGNVTEIMGKDGVPISFLWGYQGQFPVAKIENATIQQVYNGTNVYEGWATYAEPPFPMWSKIELLKTELPNARITTFEYKPLQGVVSITDPNNITTKFEYDNYGRLTGSYFLDIKSSSDIRKIMLQKYVYNLGK